MSTVEIKKETDVENDDGLAKAFRSIVGVLVGLGGALVGLLAVACFIGWKTAENYFQAFEAGWVTTAISPNIWIQWAYQPLVGIVIGLVFGLAMTIDKTLTRQGLRRAQIFTSFVAVALMGTALFGDVRFGVSLTARIGALAAIFFELSLGLAIVSLAYALRDRKFRWNGRGLGTIYIFWLGAATLQLPYFAGYFPGVRDSSPVDSKLPVARIEGEEWRVLAAMPERLVLVKLSTDSKPIVRIVPVEKVTSVSAPVKSNR